VLGTNGRGVGVLSSDGGPSTTWTESSAVSASVSAESMRDSFVIDAVSLIVAGSMVVRTVTLPSVVSVANLHVTIVGLSNGGSVTAPLSLALRNSDPAGSQSVITTSVSASSSGTVQLRVQVSTDGLATGAEGGPLMVIWSTSAILSNVRSGQSISIVAKTRRPGL
jgi:hypothetical protein